MSDFTDQLPDPECVNLEPEELAGYLLEVFHSIPERARQQRVMQLDWLGGSPPVDDLPAKYRDPVSMALMEAWSWLERQGLVRPILIELPRALTSSQNVDRISSGERMSTHSAKGPHCPETSCIQRFRKRRGLHSSVASLTQPDLSAFKEVEVAVRAAGHFDPTDLGTDLMRKAFNSNGGPLADVSEPVPEREAPSLICSLGPWDDQEPIEPPSRRN